MVISKGEFPKALWPGLKAYITKGPRTKDEEIEYLRERVRILEEDVERERRERVWNDDRHR